MTETSAQSSIFAVADLHGRYDILEAAIDVIANYSMPSGEIRHVVFLGDYIDRGPEAADVVKRLMSGPPVGQHWTCLKGNHEEMMSLALRDDSKLEWWFDNGGDTTLESYRGSRGEIAAHLAWIETLPLISIRDRHVFVHAGLDRGLPLDRQNEETLLWKRYRDGDKDEYDGRHIVHGHDPNVEGPLLFRGRTALDTLAWRTGRLVVGVFDAGKGGGPTDLLDVTTQPSAAQLVL